MGKEILEATADRKWVLENLTTLTTHSWIPNMIEIWGPSSLQVPGKPCYTVRSRIKHQKRVSEHISSTPAGNNQPNNQTENMVEYAFNHNTNGLMEKGLAWGSLHNWDNFELGIYRPRTGLTDMYCLVLIQPAAAGGFLFGFVFALLTLFVYFNSLKIALHSAAEAGLALTNVAGW